MRCRSRLFRELFQGPPLQLGQRWHLWCEPLPVGLLDTEALLQGGGCKVEHMIQSYNTAQVEDNRCFSFT